MMQEYEWETSNAWECYSPDMSFLNCEDCARQYAIENNLDIKQGAHLYSDEKNGIGVSECYACGHEFDYPPTCDGCCKYLRESLTHEGRDYMMQRLSEYPAWLVEYYLGSDALAQQKRQIEAEASSNQVIIDGQLVGYHTRLGGLFVCVECGHLCECNAEEDN